MCSLGYITLRKQVNNARAPPEHDDALPSWGARNALTSRGRERSRRRASCSECFELSRVDTQSGLRNKTSSKYCQRTGALAWPRSGGAPFPADFGRPISGRNMQIRCVGAPLRVQASAPATLNWLAVHLPARESQPDPRARHKVHRLQAAC